MMRAWAFVVVDLMATTQIHPTQHGCIHKNATSILSHNKARKVSSEKELISGCHNEGALSATGALLHDFVSGEGIALTPSVINDSVMGGKSTSSVSYTSEGVLFQGTVTREDGGGFASVKFTAEDSAALVQRLRTGSGIRFSVQHIQGCNAWKLQLNADGNWISRIFGGGWIQWQADFIAAADNEPQQIAFSELVPTRYGKPLGAPGLAGSDLDGIVAFGFMLSFLTAEGNSSTAFSVGPFAMNVVRVEVY